MSVPDSLIRNWYASGGEPCWFPETVALGTKHGKERVLQQAFDKLHVHVEVPQDIDTDLFGTFTGEVAREGSILDAARAKAIAAARKAGCDVGLGSEGSYGPHPVLPFIAVGRELLVWHDLRTGHDIAELLIDETPRFAHLDVHDRDEATTFLADIGFPEQAVVVASSGSSGLVIEKGIRDVDHLSAAIDIANRCSPIGKARIQTDMRAHMNPRRMKVISSLGERLVKRLLTACPSCAHPGWGWVSVTGGLPCRDCGCPTALPFKDVFACVACGSEDMIPRAEPREAEPAYCTVCNP